MKIIRSVAEMQAQARKWQSEGKTVALVPTMGFLHRGHLSLVQIANQRAEVTVVSIFVNPTQFGPQEDFDSYPRNFEKDEELCRQNGVEAIFYPDSAEMYAPDHSTWVVESKLSTPLCGKSRPIHFRGVTTVVTKLFHAVNPSIAVFGQKDAQQALVIERMVRDLNFSLQVVLGPIVREDSGLAMSSRNKYLTLTERQDAIAIYRGLAKVEEEYHGGERDANTLSDIVRTEICAAGGKVDYVELVSRAELRNVVTVTEPALLAVAAFFGKTRLIDNCFLG